MDGKEALSMLPPCGTVSATSEAARKPQYLITLAATIVSFSAGNILGWTASVLPYLESADSPLPITPHQGSWIGSLLAIGAFIGAFPAGPTADIFGRKVAIIILAIPFLISWILIFFASSVYLLYIARLMAGYGLGGLCVTLPIYISEIAEANIRGTLCSAFPLMLVLGVLYTYVLGALVSYKILALLCAIVPLIFILAFFKAPETPIYLLKKDQKSKAADSLKMLRGKYYNISKELQILENEMNKDKTSFLQSLLKRASLISLVICSGLMAFQQLSGISVVIFYSGNIFKDAGSKLDPSIATIFVGLAQVVATVLFGTLIDKVGRKILLQISAAVSCVCLLSLGYYFHVQIKGGDTESISFLPLISVIIYILVFSLGLGPIAWMMTSEILPPEIKAVGTSMAVALNWFLAFTVTKTYQLLVENIGAAKTFWMFSVICLIGFFFATFVVIETKGKSLGAIQDELAGKKVNKRNSVL